MLYKIEVAVHAHAEGRVPISAVDSILREDYTRRRRSHVTLYLLSPRQHKHHVAEGSAGEVAHSYAYFDNSSIGGGSGGDCPLTKWVAAEHRYAWIDLTAGPVAYGPTAATVGVMGVHAMPRVTIGNSVRGYKAQAFIAELAALVTRSSRLLLTPPISFLPESRPDTTVTVQILSISDEEGAPTVDFAAIAAALEPLALPGQRVDVEQYSSSFAECFSCAVAYGAALTTEPIASDSTQLHVHPYIQSRELRNRLKQFAEKLPGLSRKPAAGERLIPVIVFTLATTVPHLIDRTSQAVALDGAVLAVQTRAGKVQLAEHHCAGAPRNLDSENAARQIIAAATQLGWGVSNSGVKWNEAHNATEPDLLWATGLTPFGVYSQREQPSFALRDVAARSSIHAQLVDALAEIQELRSYFSGVGLEVDDALRAPDQLLFLRRLNVLSFKLQRARAYLSLHNFRVAQYHALSARHDIAAMRKLVEDVEKSSLRQHKVACPHSEWGSHLE